MRNQNAAFGIRAASVKSVFCAAVHAVKHLVADLGKVPDNHCAGLYLAVTEELNLQAVADAVGANNSNEFVGGGYRRSVDLCDDVIGVKPCFVAGAVPDHLVDENALRNAVLLRAFRFDGYDAEPDSGLAARAVF